MGVFADGAIIVFLLCAALRRFTALGTKSPFVTVAVATALAVIVGSAFFGVARAIVVYGSAGLFAAAVYWVEALIRRKRVPAQGSPSFPAAAFKPLPDATPARGEVERSLAELQALHGKGLISDAEFEAKRADILKRL
jgi:hypothetical protein